jgi:hypothetical protein
MATIKKAQGGGLIKKVIKATTKTTPKKVTLSSYPTQESRDIARSILNTKPKKSSNLKPVETLKKEYDKKGLNMAIERRTNPEVAKKKMTKAQRQSFEVDDSYRKNGGAVKKKMKNGGSLSGLTASTKRDKGTDPKGAFTNVQKNTLAGATSKAKLVKNKQLGATKMKKK